VTSLLPPVSTPLERALEVLAAGRVDGVGVPLRQLWSAQDCPAELLPWLAWGLSIDSWDSAWPEGVRRARVASAIGVQRIKGSKKSVADVVAAFGGHIAVREWFEADPPAIPHTFQLFLALGGFGAPDAEFVDAVIAEVRRTKPARSHFDFVQAVNFSGGIGLAAAARPAVFARVSGTTPASLVPLAAVTLTGQPLTLSGDYLTLGS